MAKNSLGINITSKYLYLNYKENIYKEEIPKNIVINNRVAKSEDFFKFLQKILKKYKLNDTILSKNIYLIEYPNYLKSDKELLISILEKLSFTKVHFIKYEKLIEKNSTLNLNNDMAIITLGNQSYLISYAMFNKNWEESLLNLLADYLVDTELFVIGNYLELKNFTKKIENEYEVRVYIFQNGDIYLNKNIQKIFATS